MRKYYEREQEQVKEREGHGQKERLDTEQLRDEESKRPIWT